MPPTTQSPFRSRKPTTTTIYSAQGRTPSPQPQQQIRPATQSFNPQQSMMPNPGSGVSGAGMAASPRIAATGRPQATSFNPSLSPSAPMLPSSSPTPGGMVRGTAPDTRQAYLQSQGRLQGGDLAFGFGEMARRRISDAAAQAAIARNSQIPSGQTVMPQQTSLTPAFQNKAAQIQGRTVYPSYSDFEYGDDQVPVAQGGGGSSSPFGTSRSGLTAEPQGEAPAPAEKDIDTLIDLANKVNAYHGAGPVDEAEFRRRNALEEHDLIVDENGEIRPRNMLGEGYGESYGNLNDPDTWNDELKDIFSSGDYEGDNNLLETGSEQREDVVGGLNLNEEQQQWLDALDQAGFYVTDTGEIKKKGDKNSNFGTIFSLDEMTGAAANVLKPFREASEKSATDKAIAEYEKLRGALGGAPNTDIDTEALIQTQNERRAADRAREMRAAMEMASRSGMSPEASTGLSSGITQQSGLAQREAEEKTRLSGKMANIENQIQQYKMQADMLLAQAQMQQNKEVQQMMLRDAQQARAFQARLEEDRREAEREMAIFGAIGGGVGGLLGLGGSLLMGGGAPAASTVAAIPSARIPF